jgi:hypothetical protein
MNQVVISISLYIYIKKKTPDQERFTCINFWENKHVQWRRAELGNVPSPGHAGCGVSQIQTQFSLAVCQAPCMPKGMHIFPRALLREWSSSLGHA